MPKLATSCLKPPQELWYSGPARAIGDFRARTSCLWIWWFPKIGGASPYRKAILRLNSVGVYLGFSRKFVYCVLGMLYTVISFYLLGLMVWGLGFGDFCQPHGRYSPGGQRNRQIRLIFLGRFAE